MKAGRRRRRRKRKNIERHERCNTKTVIKRTFGKFVRLRKICVTEGGGLFVFILFYLSFSGEGLSRVGEVRFFDLFVYIFSQEEEEEEEEEEER